MCGEPPFNGRSDQEIVAAAKKGKYNYRQEIWKTRSKGVMNLIDCMLTWDPKKRITAKNASMHPWILNTAHVELSSVDQQTSILKNLVNFQSEQKIQQAALTFIVC